MSEPSVNLTRSRTQKCIIDALANLMKEKSFDSLTVKDIAARAGINRTTFYRHFRDKFDIASVILDDIIEITIKNIGDPALIFDQLSSQNSDERNFTEWFIKNSIQSTCKVFDFLKENALLYRPLLGSSGSMWFYMKLRDSLAEKCLELIDKIKDKKKESPETYTVSHRTAAVSRASMFVGLASSWLDNGMPVSSKIIATEYFYLIMKGYYRALGFKCT